MLIFTNHQKPYGKRFYCSSTHYLLLISLMLCGFSLTVRADMPNDPEFKRQWGFNQQEIGWLAAKTLIDQHFPPGSRPAENAPVAAIIDISFKYHEDLDRQYYLLGQTNYMVQQNRETGQFRVEKNLSDESVSGHGNGSLGIMSAATGNQLGIAGSGFGIIRTLAIDTHYVDEQGRDTDYMEGANINQAIDFVLAQKEKTNIVAVNMSFTSQSDELSDGIRRLGEKGIIVVAAAGNYGQHVAEKPYYPAASAQKNVISVAELSQQLTLTPSSNIGGNINIAAPGDGMLTFGTHNNYIPGGGSSQAAPFITGLLAAGVALYNQKRQANRPYDDITAAQLIHLLYDTANTSPALAGKVQQGRYVNAGRFMQAIIDCREEAIQRKSHCSVSRNYPERGWLLPVATTASVNSSSNGQENNTLYLLILLGICLVGWLTVRCLKVRR